MEVVNQYQTTKRQIEQYLLKRTFSTTIFKVFILILVIFLLPSIAIFFPIDQILKIKLIDHFTSLVMSGILIYQYLKEKTVVDSKNYLKEYQKDMFTQEIIITEKNIIKKNLEEKIERIFPINSIIEINETKDFLFLKTIKKEIIIIKKNSFKKGTTKDIKTILKNGC